MNGSRLHVGPEQATSPEIEIKDTVKVQYSKYIKENEAKKF